MSHQPERTEKNCLNCGNQVYGRFCHICGQENIVAKQGFWAMIKHFIFDIFHFDGKFFETLKHLFLRPGSLSKEYTEGKRAKYLEPIRMYLFVSAIFFILFPLFENVNVHMTTTFLNQSERKELLFDLTQQQLKSPKDTIVDRQITILKDTNLIVFIDSSKMGNTEVEKVNYRGIPYKMTYDSAYKYVDAITIHPGDNWLIRQLKKKYMVIMSKYSSDPAEAIYRFRDIFIHKMPYLLFVSLPFFAGILNLLYVRRKKYFFSDHAIFTLHHYILSFIIIMLVFVLGSLARIPGLNFISYIMLVFGLIWEIYLYLEMKRFYGQSVSKTFFKFLVLNIMAIIVVSLLFTIFLIFSVFQL